MLAVLFLVPVAAGQAASQSYHAGRGPQRCGMRGLPVEDNPGHLGLGEDT